MKNTASKICIVILALTFVALTCGVIMTALKNNNTAGTITQLATAMCAVGWVLAMRNFRLAEEGDFSSEGKSPSILRKLRDSYLKEDITPVTDGDEIPESENL